MARLRIFFCAVGGAMVVNIENVYRKRRRGKPLYRNLLTDSIRAENFSK